VCRVVVRISAEVTTPFPDRKFEGIFTISTELSPLASPAFEVGRYKSLYLSPFDHFSKACMCRPTTTEALLSRVLEKTVRRSSALDTESLCLIAGSKCFAIRADVHILVHDGNLLDAACIALIVALQHFRKPDVTVEGENVTVWETREREPVKLNMLHHPLCVSFSYFDSGRTVLVDATIVEEKVREGELIVSVNKFGEVCQMAKSGGVTVDAVALLGWTNVAVEKVKIITAYIQEKLAEDEKKRSVGGLMAELSAENAR